ncbi:MAG: hypothetical protein ACI8X5_003563 [Planctomycetota bacterium]|jgi:hypothetical protein
MYSLPPSIGYIARSNSQHSTIHDALLGIPTTMRPILSATLASLLLLVPASCGGSANSGASVEAGYSSLSSGSYSEALGSFDTALDGLTTSDPKFLEAKLGQLQAQCHVDAVKAKTDLFALGTDSGVTAKDYSMVATELLTAATAKASSDQDAASEAIGEGIAVLAKGKETFPDYSKWDAKITQFGDKAATLGSADALEALKGLGYVGGD